MYFFTHLFISKVLYQHFAGEVGLDKRAFEYGNIKPDLPSPTRNHHTLENCLLVVCDSANKLMDEETSLSDFSVSLGEICHYVCDFFCYYHLNEELHNKFPQHFLYEIRLHLELFRIRFKQRFKIMPSGMQPRRDINSIILEMRKNYVFQPQCMKRDIDYAFSSAVWTFESILYFLKYSSEIAKEAELAFYSILMAEGEII